MRIKENRHRPHAAGGILATKDRFRDDDEKAQFDALLAKLTRHFEPTGPTEEVLISEMAISLFQLQRLYGKPRL